MLTLDLLIEEIYGINKVPWKELIKNANESLVSKLQALLFQMVFSEKNVWEEAKSIFLEMSEKISKEPENSDKYVSHSIHELKKLLAKKN